MPSNGRIPASQKPLRTPAHSAAPEELSPVAVATVRAAAQDGSATASRIAPPSLLLPESEAGFWRMVSNLAAIISAPPRGVSKGAWMHTPIFGSAFLRREYASRPVLLSLLLHVIAVTEMILHPSFPFGSPPNIEEDAAVMRERTVLYYSMSDLLPAIAPPKPARLPAPAPQPAAVRAPVRVALNRAQTVVSRPPDPDNPRQTILQPDAVPPAIRHDIHIPNIVSWSAPDALAAPSPSITEIRRRAAQPPRPAAPVRQAAVMPAPPRTEALRADLSSVPLTPGPRMNVPKLAVPVRITTTPSKDVEPAGRKPLRRPAAEDPSVPSSVVKTGATLALLPNLVAISVAPAPPEEVVVVPTGNRGGEFTASPEGAGSESIGAATANDGSTPTGDSGGDVESDQAADLRLPGLSVSGGTPSAPPAPLSRSREGDDLRQLMARATVADITRPNTSREMGRERSVESEFFGTRRVYTVTMNMPNLSSGSGSWVLRFAELEQRQNVRGETELLVTPEAIRKVDPMYVAAAVREKIQGTVTLAALVLKDGTVANIRVVGSLDPRLDASAVSALTQWRFQPARRGGQPMDLEVLVQIPFRLPSL